MPESRSPLRLNVARKLSRRALLVALHREQHGPRPVGLVARETGLSERSVYQALRELRNLAEHHDHDHKDHGDKGTLQNLAENPAPEVNDLAGPAPEPRGDAQDGSEDSQDSQEETLVAELEALGIWPGPARRLIEVSGLEAVRLQVAYHRFRLASGFRFKKAAAAFLWTACRWPERFPAPEGYHAAQHRSREGIPARESRVVPPLKKAPEPAPAAVPLSVEERLETVRKLLSSTVPTARRMAERLCREWGLSVGLQEAQEGRFLSVQVLPVIETGSRGFLTAMA